MLQIVTKLDENKNSKGIMTTRSHYNKLAKLQNKIQIEWLAKGTIPLLTFTPTIIQNSTPKFYKCQNIAIWGGARFEK